MIFDFLKTIKISYGITVCNEAKELEYLLSTLLPLIDQRDDIIVLQDVTNENADVNKVIEKYKNKVITFKTHLNNDFATFKNNLLNIAKGDYLFQIDADEIPKATLIKHLKPILKKNRRNDCFLVPRINIVNGYTDDHVKQWNWQINSSGYINYPDYQPRIIKLNGKIKWKNKVHEVFTGFKNEFLLPSKDFDLCLLHVKDIVRQERQNAYYDTI